MKASLNREEGHAHVAAIRVLNYRQGRPPTLGCSTVPFPVAADRKPPHQSEPLTHGAS